jgi:hypothetical protein
MGNISEIINMVMKLGIENLPTLTVCACLWVMVKNRAGDNEK